MKTMFSKLAMVVFTLIVMAVMWNIPAFAQIQRFEDQSLEITSKLPPQYLGWKVEKGSTTQTVPMYYKVTASVAGIGETKTSPVTTAYSTYAGLCSTNSLRMMWAAVNGAAYYNVYRSADNTSFYYIASPKVLTYVDEGIANGAAFSAASPRGGKLTVENSITAGGAFTSAGAIAAGAGVSGTTLAMTGAGDIAGQFTWGAAGTKSTGTVGGALSIPGALTTNTVNISGSAQLLMGNATSAELAALAPGQAKGALLINSTTGNLVMSTATVVGSWVLVSTPTEAGY